MSATPNDVSTRRAIWWTRSFAHPLLLEFASQEAEIPETLHDLLEQADKRLSASSDQPGPGETYLPSGST